MPHNGPYGALVMGRWPDDVRLGDVIRERNTPRFKVVCSRTVIAVEDERVLTTGASGRQRNRWMSRARLRRYDLLERGTGSEWVETAALGSKTDPDPAERTR